MATLSVKDSACSRCGICAEECPVSIIKLKGEAGLPQYIEGGAARCPLCGHCEAVCPEGAITVSDPRLPDGEYELPGSVPDPRLIGGYMRMRRSVRCYQNKPVDRKTIEELLDIVRFAPTGMNRQPVHWLIIHDTNELRRLTGLAIDWARFMTAQDTPMNAIFDFSAMVKAWEKGIDPVCRSAPHLLIAHGHRDLPSVSIDGIIALSHLDLAAPSFGLGTCWAGIFIIACNAWEPLRNAISLPEGHVPVYAMMLGYPSHRFHRLPKREPLKAVWR